MVIWEEWPQDWALRIHLKKLCNPASMKNRNIVDYFSWSIVFCTTQVRTLYSTHGGCNRRLTEASFLPHVRVGQNSAGFPLCSEHPHGICTLLKHIHSASRADWKWSILGAVYYRRWIKCAAVKKHHKTASFLSNPRFWSSDLNTRMVSASLPNMFTRLRELTGSGPFWVQFTIEAEWNVRQWKNITKRPVFHQILDSGPQISTSAWYLPPCQACPLGFERWLEVFNSRCSLL